MKMRTPPKGKVWLHIDRIDREDGKVWAVQFRRDGKDRYKCFRSVIVTIGGYTQFFGTKGQPKAVIQFDDARVVVADPDTAYIAHK